jgi:anti-sigma regulatory factor (Ser/Thr protein kinase)
MSQRLAQRFETSLPREVRAPRLARGIVDAWLGTLVGAVLLDKITLLVSELVTNALLHGAGQITLRVQLDDDILRAEVLDQGPGFVPAPRRPGASLAGGWGLQIVRIESSRWGVESGPAQVWFELDTASRLVGSTAN